MPRAPALAKPPFPAPRNLAHSGTAPRNARNAERGYMERSGSGYAARE
jgi:hypothetical protein